MVKTLLKQVKEFKKDSILTPCFMILEVLMETLIPLLMGSIINEGIEAGNMTHIYLMGGAMLIAAVVGLYAGAMGGKYGARASTGFAKNLREAMFTRIQGFSFANIDKFSTAGLVTRLTTDVSNLQNAYQMILRMCIRAPFSLVIAMTAAFFVSPRIASIYLIAVLILGTILAIIMKCAMKYFSHLFE
ncbi:MAG: ABC transporter ATP-binding protein, partial [Lachnospiraceae bacterium]|nr:ABC transporter ATP-binding protein [Lachnospiraceae bacterium]